MQSTQIPEYVLHNSDNDAIFWLQLIRSGRTGDFPAVNDEIQKRRSVPRGTARDFRAAGVKAYRPATLAEAKHEYRAKQIVAQF